MSSEYSKTWSQHPRHPIVVKAFLDSEQVRTGVEVLNQTYDSSTDLVNISGKQQQWSVESVAHKKYKQFLFDLKTRVEEFLNTIFQEMGHMDQVEWKFSPVLGMLTTSIASPQCPHSDMHHPYGFVAILYLSSCSSAFFHVDMLNENISWLVPPPPIEEIQREMNSDSNSRCSSAEMERYYRSNFSAMLSIPSEEFPRYVSYKVDAGDIVIFRSDCIHFGPGSDGAVQRKMMFFPMLKTFGVENSTTDLKYDSEVQLQPWILAEKLHGRGSETWRGIMRDFRKYRPHDHYPNMDVEEAYGGQSFNSTVTQELEEGNSFHFVNLGKQ
jgi:hypothetical protein